MQYFPCPGHGPDGGQGGGPEGSEEHRRGMVRWSSPVYSRGIGRRFCPECQTLATPTQVADVAGRFHGKDLPSLPSPGVTEVTHVGGTGGLESGNGGGRIDWHLPRGRTCPGPANAGCGEGVRLRRSRYRSGTRPQVSHTRIQGKPAGCCNANDTHPMLRELGAPQALRPPGGVHASPSPWHPDFPTSRGPSHFPGSLLALLAFLFTPPITKVV